MPILELMTSSGFGSLLGMRHALEPDHLAAVSTLVSRERGAWRAAWLGLCWGAGHTLALLVVGVALVALRTELPAPVATTFEFGVSVMLVVLGLRAVRQAVVLGRDHAGPSWLHRRGLQVHQHPGLEPHVHIGHWTMVRRPLLIGAVHGLAGSGALTALVLATLPSTIARLTYVALFGLGSAIGMAALSGLLGWPLARLGAHHAVARGVTLAVGCLSTVLGVVWAYRLL